MKLSNYKTSNLIMKYTHIGLNELSLRFHWTLIKMIMYTKSNI